MRKLFSLTFLVYVLNFVHVRTACPHLEAGLVKWSDASTWTSKPVKGSRITISKKILLDESPPSLGSITIAPGGALVWADSNNITLTASYILVSGRFQIGSESCKFSKKAKIVLTGKSDSSIKVDHFGRKFIGVTSGGTLELHGEDKLSWTKLAQTIPAASHTCGVVYDHEKTPYSSEWATGIHVAVWNLDGSLYDFGPFVLGELWDDEADKHFVAFINGIPNDKVVALAVHENLGAVEKPLLNWELVFQTIENLGGIEKGKGLIRNVKNREAYALITIKGKKAHTTEQHIPRKAGQKSTVTNDVHITLVDSKLKFWVESAVRVDGDESIPNDVNFRVLSTDVAYPKIEVIDSVSTWKTGDKLVFTSTDFNWRQAEVFPVTECKDCSAPNQFRVDGMFLNMHFGEIVDNVDERGEVALLTRNIVIEGEMEDKCYGNSAVEKFLCTKYDQDVFGGHLKITRGFTAAHIEGVEFHNMGQASVMGAYPIHFHMCDDVAGSWVRHNTVHDSSSRCITMHGTDSLEVSDNVCYKHIGHGYFLEDSAEQKNILDGNIGIGTMYGTLLPSDMKESWCVANQKPFCDALSTYWITHPSNYIRNNVAAGSNNVGFWFVYADIPLGMSFARQKERGLVKEFSSKYTPITQFFNNVAHSNGEGLQVDAKISKGEMNTDTGVFVAVHGVFSTNDYDPRIPHNANGKPTTVYLDRFTSYKNSRSNAWIRGGNIVLRQSSMADSVRGVIMPTSAANSFTETRTSVFIGQSKNKGMPELWTAEDYKSAKKPRHQFDRSVMGSDPNSPLQGFVFYDGPTFVTDCHFKGYSHWRWNITMEKEFPGTNTFRAAGAIGFRRSDEVFFNPQTTVSRATFSFCDNTEGNNVYDGNKMVSGFKNDKDSKLQAIFKDKDGTVTGHAGAYVVKNLPYFTSPRCSFRSNWQMSVCPHTYAKVQFAGFKFEKGKYPVSITRDDAHESPFAMEGEQGSAYHMMKNKTFTINFGDAVPEKFSMTAADMESGDFIRVGLCYPKDMTSFTLTSWYPDIDSDDKPIEVNTIKALDDDLTGKAYFWDKSTGLLFVKLRSNEIRKGWEKCPAGQCPNYTIKKNNGGTKADCRTSAYGPYKKTPEAASTEMKRPDCVKSEVKNQGAGSTKKTTSAVSGKIFQFTCPKEKVEVKVDTRTLARGCYKDTWDKDMSGAVLFLYTTMTRRRCIKRCNQMGFSFAGLQNGQECWCDNRFGHYGTADGGCTSPCKGDKSETCGGYLKSEVFVTGKAPHAAFSHCGPGSRGIVVKNVCYYLGVNRKSFPDGEKDCVALGGHLASIPSKEVQDAVMNYVSQGTGEVYFGLNDAKQEGKFVFMDGTAVTTYSNFIKGSPEGEYDEQDYGVLVEEPFYKWTDAAEDESYRYLCQIPTAVPSAPKVCPSGWSQNANSCYLYNGKKLATYELASAECSSGSQNLLTVTSKAENDFVFDLVKKHHAGTAQQIILGLMYFSYTDTFDWVDGSSLTYAPWAPGHGLLGLSKGKCVKIRSTGTEHLWENTPCTGGSFSVVCKLKIG